MIKKYSLLILTLFLLAHNTAFAKSFDLAIIDLKNRSAEEIVPLLEPFLIPEGAITPRGYKLIIKSTPANLEEIRKLVEELDTQIRQLTITVSMGRHEEQQQESTDVGLKAEIKDGDTTLQANTGSNPISGGNTSGSVVRLNSKTDKTNVTAKIQAKKSTTQRNKPVQHTIRSSEGQWAKIRTGQSVPVVTRQQNPDGTVTQTVKYHGATSGFSVLPRLQPNNRVLLYIRPTRTNVSRDGGGAFDVQSIETTVQGKLGEWVELGSANELSQSQSRTNTRTTQSNRTRQDTVFVKIDIVQ